MEAYERWRFGKVGHHINEQDKMLRRYLHTERGRIYARFVSARPSSCLHAGTSVQVLPPLQRPGSESGDQDQLLSFRLVNICRDEQESKFAELTIERTFIRTV